MTRTPAMALVLAAIALHGCGKSDPAPSAESAAQIDPQSKQTIDPATTFAQSCARCHGPEGRSYSLPFKYQGEALRAKIRAMMIGNAHLDPTDADVDAMMKYHLQIRDKLLGGQP